MALYRDPDGNIHDDMGGKAKKLPSWPAQVVKLSKQEADAHLNPPAKKEDVLAEYKAESIRKMDTLAQSWGYSSMSEAVSFSVSTDPQFKAEADALIAWRDSVKKEAINIEQKCLKLKTMKGVPATKSDYLALLPADPVRP